MATLVGQASALHALAGEGAGEVLRRLLDDLPAAGKTEEALKKLPGLADQAGEEARRYRAALKELGGFTPDLCGEFRTRAETLFDRASQGAGRLETLRVRLVDVSKRFEAAAGEEWNDTLRGLAKAAVEAFHDVDPEQVPERIEKQLREVLKPLEELINQALALLTKVKSDIEAGTEVEKLRKLARTGLQQLHAVLLAGWARVDEALSRGLGRWAGGRLSAVRVALVQLWTEAQKAITAAEAQIERDFATVDGWRTAVLAEVKKVTDVLEGAKKEAAEGPAAVAAKAHAAFGTWKAAAATLFPVQAAQQLKDLIGAVPPREFAARLRALREPLEEHSVTDTLARWRQGVGTAAATLCGHVVPGQEELKKAVDLLSGMMDPAPVLERLLKTAPPAELTELRRALEAQRAAVDAVLRPAMQGYAEHLRQAVDTARREVQALAANGDSTLRVLRAFGDAPRVPNLEFNRRKVEYWFDEASKQVGMTPVVARVRTALSGAQAELQALGTRIPTRALLDRLLPDALERFSVSKLFPNFAGMDLEGLFPSLRLPANARDNVRITHGVDRQSLQAWLEAVVDVAAAQPATVFAQGPITVRLLRARFQARARVEAAPGRPPATLTTGSISGDWEVAVAGTVLVILRDTSLVYDSTGQLRFNISADRVELQAALRFLSQLMASIGYSESGFSIGMLPLPQVGVRSALDLPLPDLQFGAFGIANLRLLSSFALQMDGGFQVAVALAVGSKTSPFALSVMALTGGGWMEFDARYRPSTGVIQARVTIGIVAGASLRVSLGPIRGGVWVTFGIYAEFRTGAGGGLAIGFVLILAGEVCLAGIVTVSLTLRLEARYGPDGSVTGYGSVSIKIKICWCFTLKIRRDVQYVLVSGSSQQQALAGNEYRDAARDYLNRFE